MSSIYRKTFEIEIKDALNSLLVEISIAVLPAPIPEVENTGPTFDVEDFDGTAFPIESQWQTYMDLQQLINTDDELLTDELKDEKGTLADELSQTIDLPGATDA